MASPVAGHRLTGPAAPRHVGSFRTGARTRVPCISRQILNHCATREAPGNSILDTSFTLTRDTQSLPESWRVHFLNMHPYLHLSISTTVIQASSTTWSVYHTSLKTGLCWHHLKTLICGTSLVVQWLRLHAPNAGGLGSIPGQGTRFHMHAATKSSHASTKDPACRN